MINTTKTFRSGLLPYLLPFSVPLICVAGIEAGGVLALSLVFYLGVFIPVADRLLQKCGIVHSRAATGPDWEDSGALRGLLYAYGLVYWGVIVWSARRLNAGSAGAGEILFHCWFVGLVGSIAVTAAHELLHKHNKADRWGGLLTMLGLSYMFFETEHLYGHHAKPATAADPTSAERGEGFYRFLLRSTIGIARTVYAIDQRRLQRRKMSFWNLRNESLWFVLLPLVCGAVFFAAWGWRGALFFYGQGFMSYVYLEVISYLQHYGLRRRILPGGRPENLHAGHSWHADFPLSNLLTFELHKHSDHHYDARKPYYRLEVETDGPRLPFGYPLMTAIAMCPPLFHRIINPVMARFQNSV
jgi:alkane 1-monooxygenase